MMAFGSVPFCSSRNTSIWFWCVLSTPAWHAATPRPGTTTACTPIRNWSSRSTQVADAMTTRPVLRSAAITDHVANAVVGMAIWNAKDAKAAKTRSLRIRSRFTSRISPTSLQFADGVADADRAGPHHSRVDPAQVEPLAIARVDELHG